MSTLRVTYEDRVIMHLRAYEEMVFVGTITFPLLGWKVTLAGAVTYPMDYQSVTPQRLQVLATEQDVACTLEEWTPPA